MRAEVNDDREIIDAFKRGDQDAFKKVHDLYYRQLYYFAFRMIRSEEDAQDVVSEVFEKLWKRHGNFESLNNIKAFLFITTRNACLNWHRSDKSQKKKEELYLSFTGEQVTFMLDLMAKAELFDEIYKELQNLPERQKTVLEQFYLEGVALQEIANQLNMEIGATRTMKFRALEQLRTRLKDRNLLALTLLLLQKI